MIKIDDREWDEIKQFKDPVYGYIPICRAYVRNLIDTRMMQRIKGVAQTGLRPVFSSATHDRFSHSIGVYKFGVEMYDSFAVKIRAYIKERYRKWDVKDEECFMQKLDNYLKHWKKLLEIACLLHDIGHPVQSHGFEFLYDDPYLDIEYDRSTVVKIDSAEEQDRIYGRFNEIKDSIEEALQGNLNGALKEAFAQHCDEYVARMVERIPGKPHERMSAYYIFKDKELNERVTALVASSRENSGLCDDTDQEKEETQRKIDLCFIARMIIGWEYPARERLKYDEDTFFNSIKNCIIHILNGTIDADGIDYLMRNSYAAGYDTSKIDSARLCNAYTGYEKNYVICGAFSKSALSVLEGYMSARNFEPKWLYSHHKVVYADLLTKRIYQYITRYLTDRIMLGRSMEALLECSCNFGSDVGEGVDKPVKIPFLLKNTARADELNIRDLYAHMEQWCCCFYTYLLAPCRKYSDGCHYFDQSADADMDELFHWMSNELNRYRNGDESKMYEIYTAQMKENILSGLEGMSSLECMNETLRRLLAENFKQNMTHGDCNAAGELLELWVCGEASFNDLREKAELDGMKSLSGFFGKIGKYEKESSQLMRCWIDQHPLLLSKNDFEDFIYLLTEYQTRSYRNSLWKSQPEYYLFLKECGEAMGVSIQDIHRYMEALITDGMEEHGFTFYEGAAAKTVTDLYREQLYYLPQNGNCNRKKATELAHRRKEPDVVWNQNAEGKYIAQKWAAEIFVKTDKYDFSRNSLVVKFCRMKPKRFDDIDLLFGEKVVPLKEVFSGNKDGGTFPYFYYKWTEAFDSPADILKEFKKRFIEFCREYRRSEVKGDSMSTNRSYTVRDAVHGDIEIPADFYEIICTKEFQRLGRIRQLATADRAFPNASHMRLAHSLGTWHVMSLILEHFKKLYGENQQLKFTKEERDYALLAALLHDLGHGPYSHAMETVFGLDHEKMTQKILMDESTEIHGKIEKVFGAGTCRHVCELLSGNSTGGNVRGINLIYSSLISGQLDADRIDYLLRDNIACGMAFGHIDIQQLISSMKLMPIYDKSLSEADFYLCFDDKYLSAIEQFIYARYQMYKNVYHDPKKQLFEHLFNYVFQNIFDLLDAVEEDGTLTILKQIREHKDDVKRYLYLDDDAVNMLIRKWADGNALKESQQNQNLTEKAKLVEMLSQAFLYQTPAFERIDLGNDVSKYDLLAKRVGKKLNEDISTFAELSKKCCAFIYIQGNDSAYKIRNSKDNKSIILRSMDDGTTRDYAESSMFRNRYDMRENNILETDYYYLFFSEELLNQYFIVNKDIYGDGNMDKCREIANDVKNIVDSAKPRKNIEIEKKFYCTEEQLNIAMQYLDMTYPRADKTEKMQKDTYFDYRNDLNTGILYENKYSFRRREKDDRYIFTVKIPTDSANYDSPAQFARHEYEFISENSEVVDETYQFLIDTIDLHQRKEITGELSIGALEPQLIVHNKRITYQIKGECEICLDTVDYETVSGEAIGDTNYQIEIELLSEPEDWIALERSKIEPLIEKLGSEKLEYTKKSKLERGMDLLTECRNLSNNI